MKSNEMAALNLDRADTRVFSKHFELANCETDEMEALGALAGLGLGENGESGVSFAAREIDGATVTYRDLKVRDETASIDAFTADLATFHCAAMTDEGPSYDRLDLGNAMIRDEDVTFNFETLNISEPTPDAAAAIVGGMLGPISGSQEGNIGFGGISLTGATVTGEGFTGKLDTLAWGETRENDLQGLADMMVENLKVSFASQDGADGLELTFDGMSARNFAVGGLDASQVSTSGVVGSVLDGFTLMKKPYDEFVVGQLKLASPEFDVNFQGIEGQATENGDVVSVVQTLKPVTINLKPEMGQKPNTAGIYQQLKTLGFESMRFSGSSESTLDKRDDSLTVSDGLLIMDDAFRLNFEYSAEGLNDMVETMKGMTDLELRQNPLAAYDPLKLRSMRITLEDNSITTRGLKLASEMTGQSEKNVKRMLGVAVLGAALAAQNDVQAEVYSETTAAFADFVKNGGTLTIEANPPEPFPLTPLISGGGEDIDPDTLGFSASQAPTE
ncbi:hypothetical protein [Litorimonas sp. WD9-15]|uniref:hypothetical protein n=1 Tax=Litorimonas sp. WD9-15 TaxID=3418716 RepID=UPI003D06C73D